MSRSFHLGGFVTGFQINGSYIDCICKNQVKKLQKGTGEVLLERTIFQKDGLSRDLLIHQGQVILRDFCMLHSLDLKDYHTLHSIQLGSDLSSDLCGMIADSNRIYASIRNGSIAVIDQDSFQTTIYPITEDSMWSLLAVKGQIICGSVGGKLLFLDQESMNITNSIQLSKQNIRSLVLEGDILYVASQDKKLSRIDLQTMECTGSVRNVHKKMFDCIGTYKDYLLTVSYPCSELSFLDKDTLHSVKTISIPLSLSGKAIIDGDQLYITSRNIMGIEVIPFEELI